MGYGSGKTRQREETGQEHFAMRRFEGNDIGKNSGEG